MRPEIPLSAPDTVLMPLPLDSQDKSVDLNAEMQRSAELHDYVSCANPPMPLIPVAAHPPEIHCSGPSRVEFFDLSEKLQVCRRDPAIGPVFVALTGSESMLCSGCNE
jgi:hypothetical protein